MPLGGGAGSKCWTLRDFFLRILTLLPPMASVFHKHMSSFKYIITWIVFHVLLHSSYLSNIFKFSKVV